MTPSHDATPSKLSAVRLFAATACLATACLAGTFAGGGRVFAAPDAAVNVEHFGAIGDNQHDNTAAFNAALSGSRHIVCTRNKTYLLKGIVRAALPNTTMDFSGCKIHIAENPTTIQFMDIEADNVTVNGLYLIGVGNGIQIGASKPVSNIQILNFTCDSSATPSGLSQCIFWGEVTNLIVDHPNFIGTGYGMLQMPSKPSHGLKVTHGTATDMYGDAIEQNGQANGVATDILIDDFTFNGSHGFPSPATEERFAGFTSVDGLTITNSHVKQANGDACLHFEGSSKHIALSNNSWADCQVSGGNSGYIYVLTGSADIKENGDTFTFTGAVPGAVFAYDTSSNSYGNAITAQNLKIVDSSGQHRFGGFNLLFHFGPVVIQNVQASGLSDFVRMVSTVDVTVANSQVADTMNGIYSEAPTKDSGCGGENITLTANRMRCLQWCIFTGTNRNGTGAPKNWKFSGNSFQGRIAGVDLR